MPEVNDMCLFLDEKKGDDDDDMDVDDARARKEVASLLASFSSDVQEEKETLDDLHLASKAGKSRVICDTPSPGKSANYFKPISEGSSPSSEDSSDDEELEALVDAIDVNEQSLFAMDDGVVEAMVPLH